MSKADMPMAFSKTYYNDKNQRHRLDGPAYECIDGTKIWFVNDERHRLDGPACEYSSGDKRWYVNGKQLTEQEFNDHPLVREYKLRQTFEGLLNE